MADQPDHGKGLETPAPKSKKGRMSGPKQSPSVVDEVDPDFDVGSIPSEEEDDSSEEEEEEMQEEEEVLLAKEAPRETTISTATPSTTIQKRTRKPHKMSKASYVHQFFTRLPAGGK